MIGIGGWQIGIVGLGLVGLGLVVLEYHECVASVHAGIVAPCHDA